MVWVIKPTNQLLNENTTFQRITTFWSPRLLYQGTVLFRGGGSIFSMVTDAPHQQ